MTVVVRITSKNFATRFAKRAGRLGDICIAINQWKRGVFTAPITSDTKAVFDSSRKFWTVDRSDKSSALIMQEMKDGVYL